MFYLYLRPAFSGPYDNFFELFFSLQTLRQPDRIGEFRSGRGGLGAEFTSRNDNTLFPDGIDYFRHRYAHLGQSIRFYPYAHGVITGTDDIHTTDTFYTG